jgi:two-component system, sensor histidine kinase and response regulator
MGDEERFVQARVAEGLAARFIRGNRKGLVAHLLSALVVAFLFIDLVPRVEFLVWLVFLFGSFLARHLVVWRIQRGRFPPDGVFGRLFLVVALVGVSWGMGAAVLPGGAGTPGLGVTAVLFVGLVAFASSTLAAHPPSFHLFTAILLGSALFMEMSVGDPVPGLVPLLLIGLFWLAMLWTHRNNHGELVASLTVAARVEWGKQREGAERQILEGFLRGAPGVVAIVDRSERIVRANHVAAVMGGVTEEEMVSRTLEEVIPFPETMADLRGIMSKAWEEGLARGEISLLQEDGERKWFRVSASRGQGVVSDFLFLQGEDVSSLRRAEAARQEAEDLYRGLVDSAQDLVWRVDQSGRWTFLNNATHPIYGLAPEEMLGRSYEEFVDPSFLAADREAFQGIAAGAEIGDHETVHLDADGNPRRLSFSIRPVLDAGGRLLGAQGTARDVTERATHREALERVAEQSELIASLLDASQDLIFIKDAAGVYRGCNSAFSRQLTLPEGSILGRTDADLYPAWRASSFLESDAEAYRTRGSVIMEEWQESPGGELRLLQTVKTPQFGLDGNPRGIIGIARDVTENRLQEERARQVARDAERASLMKTTFLANMSHEIRTPMNGVLGMTEILLDSGLNEEQVHFAEMVKSSAVSLLAILNDILDLSKIEAGRLELEETSIDLPGTVSASVRVLALSASARENELLVDLRPEVPTAVVGDAARLRQVLTNLVGNAIKFTRGGEVVVVVSVEEDAGDLQWVRFAVRDTGVGIPADKLEAIFEEFQQADVSTTRTHGGTGLGLAISRRLVRMMGGDLKVKSTLGEGSEFSFTLPFRRAPEGSVPRETGRDPTRLAGARVLVVDDNSTNRRILREFLEGEDVVVDEATSVDSGLKVLRAATGEGDPYDAVLTDIQMPDRGGMDLLEEIRTDAVLKDTRIMILASGLNPGDGARARELGVQVLLQKPASRDEVLTSLARVLAEKAGRLLGSAPDATPLLEVDPGEQAAGPSRRFRILVAEDNRVNQQIVLAMLGKAGHDVELVENGVEAVRRVGEDRFDLVLMDVQMPEMDGLEATKTIRKMGGYEDLPIVAVTAHALSEERQRCRDAGMNDFLSKPFRPHALLAIVERWGRVGEGAEPPEVEQPPEFTPREAGVGEPSLPPVDLEEFRGVMREAGIESVVGITLQTYVSEAPRLVAAILAAGEEGEDDDGTVLASAAHAYKSSAGNIRAKALHALLGDLESQARTGGRRSALPLLERVQQVHEEVMGYLRQQDELNG